MDSYLIVNTIQLGMVLTLFTEGRLEAGTPQWLLRFYMLTLGSAFMYLILSVWLAMHASVVAQTSSTRLRTQFVRLPIPTWQYIDKMRTYAASFENLGSTMVRIPFLSTAPEAAKSTWNKKGAGAWASAPPGEHLASDYEGALDAEKGARSPNLPSRKLQTGAPLAVGEAAHDDDNHYDAWGLEEQGNEIAELKEQAVADRPHIGMLREEALHWQCHDTFARVAMSFGTNQFIFAIIYFCMGYVSIADGAPMPAWCVTALMLSVSITLINLDFVMTPHQKQYATLLIITGPCCVALVVFLVAARSPNAESVSMVLLPIAYMAHASWLGYALHSLGMVEHSNGAWLPMRFRAMAYLDVFGWYHQKKDAGKIGSKTQHVPTIANTKGASVILENSIPLKALKKRFDSTDSEPATAQSLERMEKRLHGDLNLWESQDVQALMDPHDQNRVLRLSQQFQTAAQQQNIASTGSLIDQLQSGPESGKGVFPLFEGVPEPATLSTASSTMGPVTGSGAWLTMKGHTDCGTEVPYLFNAENGDIRSMSFDGRDDSASGSSQPKTAFTKDLRMGPLSLTQTEEHVQQFCKKSAKAQTAADGAGKFAFMDATQRQESCPSSSFQSASAAANEAASWFLEEEAAGQQHGCSSGSHSGRPRERPARMAASDFESSYADSSDSFHGPATDYGKFKPGKVPWSALRSSTYLLIALWCTGPLLSFNQVGGPLEFGFMALRAEDAAEASSDRNMDPGQVATAVLNAESGSLPSLAEGLQIQVAWPRRNSFMPRSISCDPSGKQLVVADDFGVYSGQLFTNHKTALGERKLRGAPSESEDLSDLAFRFVRSPPCTAFEGQAVKDIGVVCTRGSVSECRVLVLHANGRRLTECPLSSPKLMSNVMHGRGKALEPSANIITSPAPKSVSIGSSETGDGGRLLASGSQNKIAKVRPSFTWRISKGWLEINKERVEALAVNNECLSDSRGLVHAFLPDGPGCLVVGTTQGRVVQLRRHVTHSKELVPEMSMQQRPHSVVQGTLHVLSGGIVMALRPALGTVQALDVQRGDILGEWKLPVGISWITLCGAEDHLYMLGRSLRSSHRRVTLWRFPVPRELKAIRDGLQNANEPSTDTAPEASELYQAAQDRLYEA